ncbi:hypothetical protein [Nocardioides sp.]|uniref:hypothetical protein n=1 Tax=Nocardioides sp. TaxID=35761 RepID=UPI0037842A26
MPTFGRRWLQRTALTTAAAVVAATAAAAVAPGAAQAVTPGVSGTLSTVARGVTENSDCTVSPSTEDSLTYSPNGATRRSASATGGTTTSDLDGTDTASWSGATSSKVTAKRTATTATVTFSASVRAQISAVKGASSVCVPGVEADAIASSTFTVPKAGWMTLRASTTGRASLVLGLVPVTGVVRPVQIVAFDPSTYAGKAWVRPGKYTVEIQAIAAADVDPSTPARSSAAGAVTASVSVQPSSTGKVTR